MTRTAICAMAAAVSLIAAGTANAAPAQLDPSFGGGDGYSTISAGFRFTSVAPAPGGKLVTATQNGTVARFTGAGDPDPDFSGDGVTDPIVASGCDPPFLTDVLALP